MEEGGAVRTAQVDEVDFGAYEDDFLVTAGNIICSPSSCKPLALKRSFLCVPE